MGEFFTLQTLSSTILIALSLQNFAQKNNLLPNAAFAFFLALACPPLGYAENSILHVNQ